MSFFQEMAFHEGEEQMMRKLNVPVRDNPTTPGLSAQLANHLPRVPLLAIGTLDTDGRPWTTIWGGEHGIAQAMGSGLVGIRTLVPKQFDPVVEGLVGKEASGNVIREAGQGKMIGGLTIDLMTRKRTKLYGRMIAGALTLREDEVTGNAEQHVEIQVVLRIEQSLGNCPKYLNNKRIEPANSVPELLSDGIQLPQQALDLVNRADLFFISSAQHDKDMDTNHRGGPAGFFRVVSNMHTGAILCWPEYSGNRLYQTLGNLVVNPKAGICVPDFATGDMLYMTGTTEILIGKDAADLLPRSNLCVRFTVTAARFVAHTLPFRGKTGEASPYNPNVRYLATEKTPVESQHVTQRAKLISQTELTSTISRFRFSLENAASYTAGQYVTFDFSEHLNLGYSHMRDDDPRSLNDDFIRTFTVSSPPGIPPNPVRKLRDDEFEVTMRKVGVATEFLFKQHAADHSRSALELDVKGFGGEFEVQQNGEERICFIAAGVGITPLLPSLSSLDLSKVKLLWTVRRQDIGLVQDTVANCRELSRALTLFVTDLDDMSSDEVTSVQNLGVDVKARRIVEGDVRDKERIARYYLCTGVPMRQQLTEWLPSETLVFEDFNF